MSQASGPQVEPEIPDEGAPEREARAAAEAAEGKFRGLLDSAPDSIVIVDQRGMIAIVNRRVEEMFGYERDELLGQPVEVLIPERFRGRHAGHREAYAAAPRTRPMGVGLDLYARRKDGTELPVEISLSPLGTPEGTLVTSIIRDVTERKRAEMALRESENRFRAIFEGTFEFVGLLAPDGTVIEANRTALDFAGVRREDVVGRPFWETKWWARSAENRDRLRAAIAEASEGAFVRYEVDILSGEGGLRLSTSPSSPSGMRAVRWCCSSRKGATSLSAVGLRRI